MSASLLEILVNIANYVSDKITARAIRFTLGPLLQLTELILKAFGGHAQRTDNSPINKTKRFIIIDGKAFSMDMTLLIPQ